MKLPFCATKRGCESIVRIEHKALARLALAKTVVTLSKFQGTFLENGISNTKTFFFLKAYDFPAGSCKIKENRAPTQLLGARFFKNPRKHLGMFPQTSLVNSLGEKDNKKSNINSKLVAHGIEETA